MSTSWHRLFITLSGDDPNAEAARTAEIARGLLSEQGYQPYDPFPGGTGTPPGMATLVRVFVAPPQEGTLCILGEYPAELLPELSRRLETAILSGWLTENDGGFALYHNGMRHDSAAALAPYMAGGETIETLHRALAGELEVEPLPSDGPPVAMIPADSLPPELQAMALDQGVDPSKAGSIFERLSGNLFGKLGKQGGGAADQDQARAMFAGAQKPDVWNSLHGQRVRAIADVLDLPGNWRLPSLETLRDAYQVHRLRQRSPRMPLMPGDDESLRAVRDALSYTPIYMGRA